MHNHQIMDEAMSSAKLYKVLLNIAHTLYTFVQILYSVWVYIKNKITIIYHEVEKNEYRYVNDKIKSLKKVPQHLAVILGPETPSYNDLVNFVVWCTTSGIPFISFYDHNGILKKNKDEFYKTISETSGLVHTNGFWIKKEAPYNGYKNEFTRKIHISVFSLSDGRNSIVEMTRHLTAKSVNISDISVDYLDQCLNERLNKMPDPDLAIYCGDTCSTFGFPPWHVRVTEFVNLRTHHNIKLNTFLSLLQFYGQCEQRLGK